MFNSRLLLAIVTLCSACGGSSFEAGGTGGSSGSTADAGTTGSNAGATSSAGATSGGSAGESSAGAGGHSAGGAATAGAGGSSAGGSSAGGSSAGAGGAGAGAGGSSAGAGGSSACDTETTDCAKLKCEYAAAVELARVCDKGSSDQCTTSSTLPNLGGCSCPTLVNAKSDATTLAKQKYQAFQNAKCPVGPVCNIACAANTSATCSAATVGNTFVCTGSHTLVPTN
jgi:hypothetical protein